MDQQTPTIGHNSASYLQMIEGDPGIIFRDETAVEGLIAELRKSISEAEADLTTDKGRKAIASRAAQISRRKTAIDEHGKSLNADKRKEIDAVDAVRRTVRLALDDLRDEARKPLTEWEKAEELRWQKIEDTRARIKSRSNPGAGATVHLIDHMISDVEKVEIPDSFGEQKHIVEREREAALLHLRRVRADAEKQEAERRELEQLRREKAERERQEAERAEEEKKRRLADEAAALRESAEKAKEAHQTSGAADMAPEPENRPEPPQEARDRPDPAPSAPAPMTAPAPRAPTEDEPRSGLATAMGEAKRDLISICSLDEKTARAIVLAIAREQIANTRLTF